MYYFDHEYLQQYLHPEGDLHVFVDQEYLIISDASDLQDPVHGIGYDVDGKPKKFDYRGIELIKVNDEKLTKDHLQTILKPEDEQAPEEDAPEPDGEETEESPTDGEEEKEDEPKKEESVKLEVGQYVENVNVTAKDFNTRGAVISVDEQTVAYRYYSQQLRRLKTVYSNIEDVRVI